MCEICETDFSQFSGVSFVDFEQVNTGLQGYTEPLHLTLPG